jgi:predicted DNA-binding transcriptional regulator AlpA
MSPKESSPVMPASRAASGRISLSPYVNEQFPNWGELLSARDLARLTRRPRWFVLTLAALGRLPRKQRFHGRTIGWLRSDVLHWLARDLPTTRCRSHPSTLARSRAVRRGLLPPGYTQSPHTVRERLGACMAPWASSRVAEYLGSGRALHRQRPGRRRR